MPEARSDSAPSFSPLYRQIKAALTRSLAEREWGPGEPIPSEFELAARFNVSQGTVRKAIDELAAENVLVRRQGRGTFVATHAEQRTRYRFLRLAADDGTAPVLDRRLIDLQRQRASAQVARALQLSAGAAVLHLRRLLLTDAKPVVLESIWLPDDRFQGLSAERLTNFGGPMYRLFEVEFGVNLIRAQDKIRSVLADAPTAQLMGLQPGAPLLSVDRIAFTYGDQAVEFRRGLYDTTAHFYRNELS
jgi:GntR family transcriptional regulator